MKYLNAPDDLVIDNETGKYILPQDADQDWIVTKIKQGIFFDGFVANKLMSYYRGGLVLDVGANFGQLSVLLYRLALGSSYFSNLDKIVSFEANPVVFSYLRRNLENNIGGASRSIFGAVWNQVGELVYMPIFNKEKEVTYGSYSLIFDSEEGYPVGTITIDSFNFERPIGAIKIDVQGADLRALEGSLSTISKHRPPICVEFESKFADKFGDLYSDYLYFFKFHKYEIVWGKKDPSTGSWNTNLFAVPAI